MVSSFLSFICFSRSSLWGSLSLSRNHPKINRIYYLAFKRFYIEISWNRTYFRFISERIPPRPSISSFAEWESECTHSIFHKIFRYCRSWSASSIYDSHERKWWLLSLSLSLCVSLSLCLSVSLSLCLSVSLSLCLCLSLSVVSPLVSSICRVFSIVNFIERRVRENVFTLFHRPVGRFVDFFAFFILILVLRKLDWIETCGYLKLGHLLLCDDLSEFDADWGQSSSSRGDQILFPHHFVLFNLCYREWQWSRLNRIIFLFSFSNWCLFLALSLIYSHSLTTKLSDTWVRYLFGRQLIKSIFRLKV